MLPEKPRKNERPSFDPGPGRLVLDDLECPIDGALSRTRFLAAAGTRARPYVLNEPWTSYALPATTVDGAKFYVIVLFHDERLESASLIHSDPSYGNWSEGSERARKTFHDEWLAHLKWDHTEAAIARIESALDARGGESAIVIHYPRKENA